MFSGTHSDDNTSLNTASAALTCHVLVASAVMINPWLSTLLTWSLPGSFGNAISIKLPLLFLLSCTLLELLSLFLLFHSVCFSPSFSLTVTSSFRLPYCCSTLNWYNKPDVYAWVCICCIYMCVWLGVLHVINACPVPFYVCTHPNILRFICSQGHEPLFWLVRQGEKGSWNITHMHAHIQ